MLYCGEQIGDGSQDPKVDIAVDPLDGTTLISQVRSALPPALCGALHYRPLWLVRWRRECWAGERPCRYPD